MESMFETYKASGRFGPLTIPLLIGGIAIAIGLAFVYQLLIEWIPIIYISFLATLGFGVLLGMIGTGIINIGQCRNVLVGMLIGVVLSLAAVGGKFFFQHQRMRTEAEQYMRNELLGVDLAAMLEEQGEAVPEGMDTSEVADNIVQGFLDEEVTFAKTIQSRVETGWEIGRRGNGGAPIKGPFVYLIWLIEFGIISYFAVSATRGAASEPYSEKLNAWASEAEHVMLLPITSEEMVSKIKSATSVEELLEIPIPETDESMQFANYTVNSIEGQELEDAYLSVELLTFSVNAKGEQEKNEQSLVKHAVLSSEQRKQLVENASLLQEAMADFRQAVEEEENEEEESEEEENGAEDLAADDE
ncbi:MAG: hypothetical protein AB8B55_17160 [Mariniblastus sp.]